MARTKNGLDYFPLNIDFFEDDKIRGVSVKYGPISEVIALKVLCKIYKNDGFIFWNEDTQKLFIDTARVKLSIIKLREIVNEFIERNFFSKEMYERHQILTSNGIQKRYINISKQIHREITIPEKYILLPAASQPEASPKPAASQPFKLKGKGIKEKEIKLKGRERAGIKPAASRGDEKNNIVNSQKHFYDCDPKQAAAEILKKLG